MSVSEHLIVETQRHYYDFDNAEVLVQQLNTDNAAALEEMGKMFALTMEHGVPIEDLEDGHLLAPVKPFNRDDYPPVPDKWIGLIESMHHLNERLRVQANEARRSADRVYRADVNPINEQLGIKLIPDNPETAIISYKIELVPRPGFTELVAGSGRRLAL